ncbi:hypothetical protein K461DRAFT_321274 [Myriangium duriaei CBS 260.36]|uniref:Rhodopsin domain-containing protein n=1 Tax=Myriangium duriaei CBS 260.36 TaxID=1168546 RepID=A0A9P4IYI4_9PEZI|nr:hypothetical protein K461DRAFT_321274 [Myriangium duriaei CBS 260.36]
MSDRTSTGLEAVSISLMTLSTIAVGLRFYTRRAQSLPLKADDGFALLGLVTYIVGAACVLRMVTLKVIGYSRKDVPAVELVPKMKVYTELDLSYETATNLTATFVKLSVLFFYRRMFSVPGQTHTTDRLIFGTMFVVLAWVLVFIVLTFLQCGTHLSAYWEGDAAENKYCKITEPLYLALPLSNMLLEFWILLLPIPKVMKLRTSLTKRLSVIGVFVLAFAGLGASFARTIISGEMLYGGSRYSINNDRGIASTVYVFLTMLEVGISMVAMNLPTLWYLCTDALPKDLLRSVLSLSSLRSFRDRNSRSYSTRSPSNAPSLASDEVEVKTSIEWASVKSEAGENYPSYPEMTHQPFAFETFRAAEPRTSV